MTDRRVTVTGAEVFARDTTDQRQATVVGAEVFARDTTDQRRATLVGAEVICLRTLGGSGWGAGWKIID